MLRRKFFTVATEDALETEKLLQSSEVAAKSGDFGSLKDTLSLKLDNMQQQRDSPVNQGSSDYSSSSDSDTSDDSGDINDESSDDLNMDMDEGAVEKEPEEETEEDKDKKDDKKDKESKEQATESANLYSSISLESIESEFSNISTESISASAVAGSLWEGAKSAGGVIYAVSNALAYVGVNILAPGFKHLYKVVVYAAAKFIRYTHSGITRIDKEVENFNTRLSKTEQELNDAKEVIALIRKKKEEFPDSVPDKLESTFDRAKVIDRIKIGKEVNPEVTLKVMIDFIDKWHTKTNRDIENDSASIKHALHYGPSAAMNPVKVFGDSSIRKGLIPNQKSIQPPENAFVSSMRYPELLPGNMVYSCNAPNGKASNIDEVRAAYNATSCSFVLDVSRYTKVDRIDYMDLDSVERSIESAAKLVEILKEQKDIYERIKKDKISYLNSFKRYIYKLAEEDKRISLEKSLLEYVYLRGVFIDNVYLLTVTDIHEFSQKYLTNVMTYLRSNLAELSS